MGLLRRLKLKKIDANQKRAPLSSANHKVISYYTASRRQIDKFERSSQDINEIKRRRRLSNLARHWFTILACLVILIAGFYLLTLSQQPQIVITGPQYRSVGAYHDLITPVLQSDLRNRLKPLLQTNKIQTTILKSIPEVNSVTINSTLLGHRSVVNIKTADPLAIFTQTGADDLIISTHGKLLLASSKSSLNKTGLGLIQNLTTVKGQQGMQFMRPDEASALGSLIEQYKVANGAAVMNFILNTIPHEITASEPGRGYYVKYLLNEDIKLQYGALRATEAKLQQLNQKPSEYIDVRLADKVYYK